MQFGRDGDLHVVARTTGPTHNYLGLEFTDAADPLDPTSPTTIEPVVLEGNEPTRLDADEVHQQVLAGVSQANSEYGTDLRVVRIRFVVSDSPPVSIYREMAHRLAERSIEESS